MPPQGPWCWPQSLPVGQGSAGLITHPLLKDGEEISSWALYTPASVLPVGAESDLPPRGLRKKTYCCFVASASSLEWAQEGRRLQQRSPLGLRWQRGVGDKEVSEESTEGKEMQEKSPRV